MRYTETVRIALDAIVAAEERRISTSKTIGLGFLTLLAVVAAGAIHFWSTYQG